MRQESGGAPTASQARTGGRASRHRRVAHDARRLDGALLGARVGAQDLRQGGGTRCMRGGGPVPRPARPSERSYRHPRRRDPPRKGRDACCPAPCIRALLPAPRCWHRSHPPAPAPRTSALRVLSVSSALKMAVEVGLVVGTTPGGVVVWGGRAAGRDGRSVLGRCRTRAGVHHTRSHEQASDRPCRQQARRAAARQQASRAAGRQGSRPAGQGSNRARAPAMTPTGSATLTTPPAASRSITSHVLVFLYCGAGGWGGGGAVRWSSEGQAGGEARSG